jgi:dipeptidyl aminopeptidase/acylaminoacyl peptidase
MTDHYDEMKVSPDPLQAEELRQRLHARMARVSRDDQEARSDPYRDSARPESAEGVPMYEVSVSDTSTPRHRTHRRLLVTAAAAVVVGIGAAGIAISNRDSGDEHLSTAGPGIVTPRANGWVAQTFGSVFLLQEGEDDRLVDSPGVQACPAFSPDGARLMFGTSTDGGAALSVVTVAADGTVSPLTTIPLDGLEGIPCAIWAPDGRWAALAGGDAVWVVDTEAGEIRHLPGYHPRDLEWRPATDELAMTGRAAAPTGSPDRASDGGFVGQNAPIDIYTVSTGEVRTIDGVAAAELTWSPDGTTIAYTRAVAGAVGMKSGITLIDADGTNQRQLTADEYRADHGIGVTWSPRGDQIAYQRERTDCTGAACYEGSEVVLVTATDTDPDSPIGTERVIPPVVDNLDTGNFDEVFNHPAPFRTARWYANSVTWSPDGTELLYSAGSAGLMVVPVDGARPAVVLSGDGLIDEGDDLATNLWLPLQQWQPVT